MSATRGRPARPAPFRAAPAGSIRLRAVVSAAAAGVLLALMGVAGVTMAADPVTFGEPTASSKFGVSIVFKQPVTISGSAERVEILVSTPGAIGPTVVPQPAGAAPGASTLEYRVDLAEGHVVPNTTFTARWRVTDEAGTAWLGPPHRHRYADDRFEWRSLGGNVVNVHWVDGNQAFGRRALAIGDKAVAETATLLGVTESEPIDFFIYGDEDAFRAALGPSTRENVGGQAHPDIRTLFALIAPADIDASWVESVVPHELTHLVFATAIDNPYHDPPHWLNEGLAVYLSDGYDDFNRTLVERAVKDGTIMPLDGLAGAFPTTRERFFLAYAESVSAVERIVRVDGRDALVKLIRSYADGVSDDQAFQAALGRDVAGFEADWLAELGAKPPTRLGPKPAPAGPLPDGWSGPQPNPSFEILGSAPPPRPDAPLPGPTNGGASTAASLGPIIAIGAVLLVVLVVLGIRRLRPAPAASAWAETGDNRLFGRPANGEPIAPGSPEDRAAAPEWPVSPEEPTEPPPPTDQGR